MRIIPALAAVVLSLVLAACSGVEIQQSGTEGFVAHNYHYYKWRTEPLANPRGSSDPVYALDPALRREVDELLQAKGYVLDPARAQFTVDYRYAAGMQQGERSELASNITPYPNINPSHRVDQATVDNAIALGGVKPTNNIILQLNDRETNRQVWEATITKVVEDANNVNATRFDDNLRDVLQDALRPLPDRATNTPAD